MADKSVAGKTSNAGVLTWKIEPAHVKAAVKERHGLDLTDSDVQWLLGAYEGMLTNTAAILLANISVNGADPKKVKRSADSMVEALMSVVKLRLTLALRLIKTIAGLL